MNEAEARERRHEAARWLAIVREDARVARACLAMDPPALGVAAYHCHQVAEKVLKGLLIIAGAEFRMTHDLDHLASIAAPYHEKSRPLIEVLRPLSSWGIAYRYPGPETVPEPLPSGDDIIRVLVVLDQLAERLRRLSAG